MPWMSQIRCHLKICSIKLKEKKEEMQIEKVNAMYTYKIQATETVGGHCCGLLSQDKSVYVYFAI